MKTTQSNSRYEELDFTRSYTSLIFIILIFTLIRTWEHVEKYQEYEPKRILRHASPETKRKRLIALTFSVNQAKNIRRGPEYASQKGMNNYVLPWSHCHKWHNILFFIFYCNQLRWVYNSGRILPLQFQPQLSSK